MLTFISREIIGESISHLSFWDRRIKQIIFQMSNMDDSSVGVRFSAKVRPFLATSGPKNEMATFSLIMRTFLCDGMS